jgi:hypothetical protein
MRSLPHTDTILAMTFEQDPSPEPTSAISNPLAMSPLPEILCPVESKVSYKARTGMLPTRDCLA